MAACLGVSGPARRLRRGVPPCQALLGGFAALPGGRVL